MQLYDGIRATAKFVIAYICALLIQFIANSMYARVCCVPIQSGVMSDIILYNILIRILYSNRNFCNATKYIMDTTSIAS